MALPLIERISYTVKRSARRTVSLSITIDGSLEVRAPIWADNASIERFVVSKREWIARKSETVKMTGIAPLRFESGEKIFFLGQEQVLDLSASVKKVRSDGVRIYCPPGAKDTVKKALISFFKKEARRHISGRVDLLAEKHSFRFSKLRISSARTRWGSCNSKGVLSFSCRLVMAAPDVIDSVILHELCHTREMNHSKRFYAHLLKCDPDYKKHNKWLKDHRGMMSLI